MYVTEKETFTCMYIYKSYRIHIFLYNYLEYNDINIIYMEFKYKLFSRYISKIK